MVVAAKITLTLGPSRDVGDCLPRKFKMSSHTCHFCNKKLYLYGGTGDTWRKTRFLWT